MKLHAQTCQRLYAILSIHPYLPQQCYLHIDFKRSLMVQCKVYAPLLHIIAVEGLVIRL